MKKLISILIIGLFVVACKEDDPCEGITCFNGGTCINGQCDCTVEYTGPSCVQQKTPKSILIMKIEVTKFPATEPNGAGWDITDGADIYATINLNDNGTIGNLVGTSEFYYSNANASHLYDLSPKDPISIDPGKGYAIALWDRDTPDDDDLIIALAFDPYYETNGFPEDMIVEDQTARFRLYFQYVF